MALLPIQPYASALELVSALCLCLTCLWRLSILVNDLSQNSQGMSDTFWHTAWCRTTLDGRVKTFRHLGHCKLLVVLSDSQGTCEDSNISENIPGKCGSDMPVARTWAAETATQFESSRVSRSCAGWNIAWLDTRGNPVPVLAFAAAEQTSICNDLDQLICLFKW